MSEVLPLLYLHGLSGNDFGPALTQFLGSGGRVLGDDDHPADQPAARRGRYVRPP
jgi:hypothetical protein